MTPPDRLPPPEILARPDGATIAYRRRLDRSDGKLPGVVFLGGFASDMTGTKASALDGVCAGRGQAYLRFDYFGHGRSSGAFRDGTVGRWADDALAVIDALTAGPQVLVGSSLGGWIMLLAALARPQRIAGLVGVAAAPDFTEDLIWSKTTPEIRERLRRDGVWLEPSADAGQPTPIALELIEEGRRHLLLRGRIAIDRPVRLLHGMADPDVPWRTALRLAERLEGDDVVVTLVKDGDHRLSRDADLDLLFAAVAALSESRARRPVR